MLNEQMSQPQLMSNLVSLYASLQEFLVKFSQSTTSYSDYTNVNWLDINGNNQTISIPSLGFMKSDIDVLRKQLETLISNNGDTITLKYNDGTVKSFDMQKVSTLIDTLNSVGDAQFTIPNEFRAKSNWFFESFLNPLLVTSVNVSKFIQDNKIKKFSVRRVIVNTNTTNDILFFDDNFKGKNDLLYDDSILALSNYGLSYNIDDNEYELPSAINKNRGSFNVLQITESTAAVDGVSYPRIYYTLDKLYYNDILNNKNGKTFLVPNDILITSDDTEYIVLSIDKTTNRVLLERTFGNSPINVGVGVLKINPQAYRIPELQINIGYNERELIFIKPISEILDLTTDVWSNGFGFFTNELNIVLSDSSVIGLEQFYKNYVSDFGMIMLNFAKEKQVPAILGLKPNVPILNSSDFKVTVVNGHISDDKSTNDFKSKVASKENLKNQLDEINKSINDNKAKLSNSVSSNDQERLTVQKTINDLVNKKSGVQKNLTTILDELSLNIKSNINLKTEPKYRVRGFTAIPEPKISEYGTQEVIQMVYAYRYSSKTGNANNNLNVPFTDASGNTVSAYFSNWTEVVSKPRKKEYDSKTDTYIWSVEDVQNPDSVNINQVDIPINKGEQVEIKMVAVSEAGFPSNPILSDWSNSIIIQFPSELEIQTEQSVLAETLLIEDALVGFQNELNSRGLDLHLFDSIVTGDKYYAHKLESIASGLYTPEGKIINSYEAYKTLLDKITALEAVISSDTGKISVSITDLQTGATQAVKQGENVQFFAGYYKDLIKTDSGYNDGSIKNALYTINIQNVAGTVLELVSYFGGGVGEECIDSTNLTDDYGKYRRYDTVPIIVSTNPIPNVNDFKQVNGFQSKQNQAQFLYSRYYNYTKGDPLYIIPTYSDPIIPYDYENSTLIPTDGVKYLPFVPSWTDASGNIHNNDVWNGNIVYNTNTLVDKGYTSIGGGQLSEFCIHKSHPYLISYVTSLTPPQSETTLLFDKKIFEPAFTNSVQSYQPFSHAKCVEYSIEDNPTDYFKQSGYLKQKSVSGNDTNSTNYPIKLGFSNNDEFLIGKYTCGSYLYISPNTYDDISVEGNHPELAMVSIKQGYEYAISIPVVFQFRCSDKLGYIGGYRLGHAGLKNISYAKKIGIDIYQKIKFNSNKFDAVFSFDITVKCQYKQDLSSSTQGISTTQKIFKTSYNLY